MAANDLSLDASSGISTRAYPHYALPYRGLPAEIRMAIWPRAIPTTLRIGLHPNQRLEYAISGYLSDKSGAVTLAPRWGDFNLNENDLSLQILQVNKQGRTEVLAMAKGQMTCVFDRTLDFIALSRWLPFLSPLQQNLIGDISLTTASLSECCIQGRDGESRSGLCLMPLPRMREVLRLKNTSTLTIRLEPHESLLEQTVLFAQIGLPSSVAIRAHLSRRPRLPATVHWTRRFLELGYHLLTDGIVTKFQLQDRDPREELRQFFPDSTCPSIIIDTLKDYLTPARFSELHVELDWPLNSGFATVCITKKMLKDGGDGDGIRA